MPTHDTAILPDDTGMQAKPAPNSGGLPTAIDPVCGMTVTLTADRRKADYQGATSHFCSEKCQTKFGIDPNFYASGNALKRGKVAAVATKYTCPMHPEIIRDAPGNCPICGMTLEPVLPSDAPGPKFSDFTRRLRISAAAPGPCCC